MNILFFITKLEVGGCQINAISLAKALKQRGHSILFFSQKGPLYDRLRENKIDLYPINYDIRHPSLQLMHELADVVKKHKIDIIQAFDSLPLMEAYGSQFWHTQPVFGMITAQRLPPFYIPKKRVLAMVNPKIRYTYIQKLNFPPDKLILVTERLDCDFYRPIENVAPSFFYKHRLGPDTPIVTIISRIDSGKWATIALFVTMAKYWKNKYGNAFPVQFVIAGHGPAFNKLTNLVAQHNLFDTVFCIGEELDIPMLMNASDVVVGMASTCQQGLSTSTPVIVVGDGGYSEIIDEQNFPNLAWHHFNLHNIVVDNSEALLAENIYKILSNNACKMRLRHFGRAIALKEYDSNIGAKKLEYIYNELLSEKTSKLQRWSWNIEWYYSLISYLYSLLFRKCTLLLNK